MCAPCVQRFAAPQARCLRCALPLHGHAIWCGTCARVPPPFERTFAAVDYAFPWDRLIARFKFHQGIEHAAPLARLMAAAIQRAGPDAGTADMLVPVPLWPERLRERGHNQAWELARRLSKAMAIPARADALARVRDTAHQAALPRTQRLTNLHGAFAATVQGRAAVAGRRVALVDDVMTTGATATEAAWTLLRAGAAQVQVWVAARAAAD